MNNNITIEAGMKVWLKTGGPCMTVKFKTANGEWLCSWFVGNDIKEHSFTAEQLTNENPTPPIKITTSRSRGNRMF